MIMDCSVTTPVGWRWYIPYKLLWEEANSGAEKYKDLKANFRFLLSLSQATILLRLWVTEFLTLPCGGGGELASVTWRNYGSQTKDSEVEFVFLRSKKSRHFY